MKLPAREQSPLFFRQEQPQATFTGIMERLPQVVRVGIDSNLEIRQDGIQVQQMFNYHVEHEPLTVLTLDVPKLLTAESHVELMLDDRAIAQLPVNSTDDEQRSHVEVPLTNPRSGAFQLIAHFTLPQSRAVTESGQAFTVPLIAPTGVAPEHHRLAVQSETAVRIAASEEAWEVSDEPITSISPPGHPAAHFKATSSGYGNYVSGAPEEPRNLANTVVHRAWIQTWISGSIRQDRTTYQFTTTSEQLQLQLPHEVPPTNVEIRLDHQLLAAPDSNEIKISVPVTGNDTKHVLELRYQTAITNGQSNSIEAELPKLGSGAWVQRLYWQLVVPGDQHYIGSPSQLTPEFAWNWFGWGWSRQNHWDQADLENWIGCRAPRSFAVGDESIFVQYGGKSGAIGGAYRGPMAVGTFRFGAGTGRRLAVVEDEDDSPRGSPICLRCGFTGACRLVARRGAVVRSGLHIGLGLAVSRRLTGEVCHEAAESNDSRGGCSGKFRVPTQQVANACATDEFGRRVDDNRPRRIGIASGGIDERVIVCDLLPPACAF